MKKVKIGLFVLIGIFMSSFLIFHIENNYVKNIDMKLLKTNIYYYENPGIPILGTTENIFSICQNNLYFYNTSLNGSLYKVNLNQFIPILVRGNLGIVYDIDTSYAPGGDMVFFATNEYNNAIMKMNTSLLNYEKILTSTWTPQKISVDFDYRFESMFIAWRTASNVFSWNNVFEIIKNVKTDFFGVIDIQCDGYDILCYNSEEILIYNTYSTYPPSELKRIVDTGITSVFWDTGRDYIIYAQDDDYDNYADGKIIQYDYFTDEIIYIQSDIDYPVSVWCTANYIYWLQRGYWSSNSMIYRYSYYYSSQTEEHYYSKVSTTSGVTSPDRIEFQPEHPDNFLGVYWGYNQLYVINGSDITSPDTIEWMGGARIINKTVNEWTITWWNSHDLNGIEIYELIVSESESFSNYDTYWVSESEEYSYTSFEFSNMSYGDYYYKVRAKDNMGIDPKEESNVGEWSDILKVSYPSPEIPEPSKRGINIIPILIGIISVIGVAIGIGGYIFYKRRKQPKEVIKPEEKSIVQEKTPKITHCPTCGAKIKDTAGKYCFECGAKLN